MNYYNGPIYAVILGSSQQLVLIHLEKEVIKNLFSIKDNMIGCQNPCDKY